MNGAVDLSSFPNATETERVFLLRNGVAKHEAIFAGGLSTAALRQAIGDTSILVGLDSPPYYRAIGIS